VTGALNQMCVCVCVYIGDGGAESHRPCGL
jgi:hypothetical protein